VSVDLAEIRHRPQPPSAHRNASVPLKAKIETLQTEIARLDATAATHRADFERERERADRLMAELLRATAATLEAKEATARLEGELAALRALGPGDPVSRLRHLATTLMDADRRARE
jgi:chromosome segregation ATPase